MRRGIILFCTISYGLLFAPFIQAKTILNFWHTFAPPFETTLQTFVDEFNASQQDYYVQASYKGDYPDLLTNTVAAYRAGQAPHIVQVFEIGTATMMYPKGIIQPVETLFERYALDLNKSDFFDRIAAYYSDHKSVLQALPFNSSVPVLYVNKNKLTQLPEGPNISFEQVDDLAKQALSQGYLCGLTNTWPAWTQLESMLARHNLPFVLPDNGFEIQHNLQAKFNTPNLITHLTRLHAWQVSGKFRYGGRRSDANVLFTSGVCAMMIGSSGSLHSYQTLFGEQLAVYAYPYWADMITTPRRTPIGGAALWALSGFDAHTEKGMALFLHYMGSTEVAMRWHIATGYLPTRQSAYLKAKAERAYAENTLLNTIVQFFLTTPAGDLPAGARLPAFMQVREFNEQALERVWSSQLSPEPSMLDAVRQADQLMSRFSDDRSN